MNNKNPPNKAIALILAILITAILIGGIIGVANYFHWIPDDTKPTSAATLDEAPTINNTTMGVSETN